MNKKELIQVLNAVISARDAANWQGLFTRDVRQATATYRKAQIFDPLDEAAANLQKELDKRSNRRNYRRVAEPQRLPYKDD